MRTFQLHRDVDVTGISGTGVVAEGVIFDDGTAALRWRGEWPTSVVFHDRGAEAIERVHGHGGSTRLVWTSASEVPLDLKAVSSRATDCAQAEIEQWDPKPFLEVLDASQRDVGPLLAEVQRLRAQIEEKN